MLTNRIYLRLRLTSSRRKYFSRQSSTYPFSELRAIPFKISPEDAIIQMAPWASSMSVFKQLIGSLGARYLPGFGFKPLLPERITPVYFPGWMVDASVSAEFLYGDTQRRASGTIHDSYMPGCDFRVLSWVSYLPQQYNGQHFSKEFVPFTEDLKVQYGTEVICLPYTITPFAALDIANSLSYKDATIAKNLRFLPSSIKTDLFAAYPVLLPLYLAQYTVPFPSGDRPITMFIEAFERKGRIRTESPRVWTADIQEYIPKGVMARLNEVDVSCLRGIPSIFFSVSGFLVPDSRGIAQVSADWLNDIITKSDSGPTLVKETKIIVSDADPRIRPFLPEERRANQNWMKLGGEIESLKRMVASMKETHNSGRTIVIGSTKEGLQNIFDNTINELESKLAKLEAEQEERKPSWWKEWLKIRQPISKE